jgi:predicted transposase YdaD
MECWQNEAVAQFFDTSLKALFLREGDGIIRRMLFGGPISEFLATEQPRASTYRTDFLVRTVDGELRHIEFQATNEPEFGLRMLDYYVHLVKAHRQHVVQVVLFVGRGTLRLEDRFTSPSTDHRYTILDISRLEAAPLLGSADWADNLLAMLADGDPEQALDAAIGKLRACSGEERDVISRVLTLLSGVLNLEEKLQTKFQEADMIDVMSNKILGPAIRQGIEQGLAQGRLEGKAEGRLEGKAEGRLEGKAQLVSELLAAKFGRLPAWAQARLNSASQKDLDNWAKRLLVSSSLEDTLA